MRPGAALLLAVFFWPCLVLPLILVFRVFRLPVANAHERIGRVVTAVLKGVGYGFVGSLLIWGWIVIAAVMLVWLIAQPFGGIEELPSAVLISIGVVFLGGATLVLLLTPNIRTWIFEIVD